MFDRSLRKYETNRNNAADSYMTNYGVSRDIFDRSYRSYLDDIGGRRRAAELEFNRDWDLYNADLDTKKFLVQEGNK